MIPSTRVMIDFWQTTDVGGMYDQRLIWRCPLCFLHQRGYALGLPLLVVVVERAAILLDGAFNHMTVDEEFLVFNGFGLLDLAVGVDVLSGL